MRKIIILLLIIIGTVLTSIFIFKPKETQLKNPISQEIKLSNPTLSITVVDDLNRPLKAEITYYDENMNELGKKDTDNNGQVIITFDNTIENAKFYYKETQLDTSLYKNDTKVYDIEITKESRTFSNIIKNKRLTGTVEFHTFESNGTTPKGGIKYTIYTTEDKYFYTVTSYPASGICGVYNIPIGDYYYVINSTGEKTNFSITHSGEKLDFTKIFE